MISVLFQGRPFNITVIQVYAPTSNTEEAEVERFYEDLQDLLELIPKKDVLFIIGDWNAKVGSQETPGVTDKFGLEIRNEAGQRLIEFHQENALVIKTILLYLGSATKFSIFFFIGIDFFCLKSFTVVPSGFSVSLVNCFGRSEERR